MKNFTDKFILKYDIIVTFLVVPIQYLIIKYDLCMYHIYTSSVYNIYLNLIFHNKCMCFVAVVS